MIEFNIPYPDTSAGRTAWNKAYGLNAYWAGKHWAKRKADADFWHTLTWQAIQGLPKMTIDDDYPVIISMYFNDRLDAINHAAIFKMIEDALKGELIIDDSRRFVAGSEIYYHSDDCIRVQIKNVKNYKNIVKTP